MCGGEGTPGPGSHCSISSFRQGNQPAHIVTHWRGTYWEIRFSAGQPWASLKPLYCGTVVLNRDSFGPRTFVSAGRRFGFGGWESAAGLWWVETRDAGKHPAAHRIDPTTQNDLAQDVCSAEGEKACCGVKGRMQVGGTEQGLR